MEFSFYERLTVREASRTILTFGVIFFLLSVLPTVCMGGGGGHGGNSGQGGGGSVIKLSPHSLKCYMPNNAPHHTYQTYLDDNGTLYPKGSTLVVHLWCHSPSDRSSIRDETRLTIPKNNSLDYFSGTFEALKCAKTDDWSACMEFDGQKGLCRGTWKSKPEKVRIVDWQIYIY